MQLSSCYVLLYTFFYVSQVFMTTFSPDTECQHNTRMVYLDDYAYDAESVIIEEIPAGGCFYVYMVGDVSFG